MVETHGEGDEGGEEEDDDGGEDAEDERVEDRVGGGGGGLVLVVDGRGIHAALFCCLFSKSIALSLLMT